MNEERIILAGASGLIGRALMASLAADGIETVQLVRRETRGPHEREWHPETGELDAEVLRGARAVVNLSGASIGKLPWTKNYRVEMWASRTQATSTLARAVASLGEGAPAFVSASAVGFYGDRPGETLTEHSGPGDTFLSALCVDWENAATPAIRHSRVSYLRTAPVLHPEGVLKPLMLLTTLGVSGPLGRGKQAWPWMSLDDEVRAIRHIIDNELEGAFNLTGPTIASANDIGRALARALKRPFLVPAPAWALRLGLGSEAAEGLLLSDARVLPKRLLESGFEFTHITPESAIAAALEKNPSEPGA